MSLLLSKSKRLLGIHVSLHTVQVVELSKKGQVYCVENYAISHLQQPENTIAVAKLVRQLCQTLKTDTKRAVVAVPDARTLCKLMSVSTQLSLKNIEELAAVEVNKLLPQEAETLYYDFQWNPPTSDDSSVHDLVILAARRVDVDQRMHLLTAAGLRAQAVDVVSQALYRVLKYMQMSLPATVAWIYLEDAQVHLYVFHLGNTLFVHSEPLVSTPMHDMATCLAHIQRAIHMFQVAYPLYVLSHAIVSSTDVHFETMYLSIVLNLEIQCIHPFDVLPLAKHLDKNVLRSRSNELLIALGLALRI